MTGSPWHPHEQARFDNILNEEHTRVYEDIVTSGVAVASSGASVPVLTTYIGSIKLNAFTGSGSQVNEAFMTFHLPHGLEKDRPITFHVHWSHNAASPSGDVKWYMDVTAAKGYGAEAYAAPTTMSAVHTSATRYNHEITSDDAMAIAWNASLEPDAVILARLYRDPADAADTFANNAFLISVDAHYSRVRVGTTERNRPFTSGGFDE